MARNDWTQETWHWTPEWEDNYMNKTFPLRGYPANTPLPDVYHDKVAAFCAEEVRRQGDTPWHVYKMMVAWKYAKRNQKGTPPRGHMPSPRLPISTLDILEIAAYIDEANENGFRQFGVRVGHRNGADWREVPRLVQQLVDAQTRLTPEEFYLEFEIIHPFADGNGRTGKVVYNWLMDKLDDPVWPPDFFGGIENP